MKRERALLPGSCVQLVLFILLARWVKKHPYSLREIILTRIVQRKQTTPKRRFVKVVSTATGSAVTLNILVAPVAFILWRMKLRIEAIMALAALWLSSLTRVGIKRLIDRPRPKPLLVRVKGQSRGKSFPSGHVVSSINFWGWLCIVALYHKELNPILRKALLSAAPLFILFIGPTRVYLGDHWSTDVLGGYLYGGASFCFSLRLYLALRESGVLTSK